MRSQEDVDSRGHELLGSEEDGRGEGERQHREVNLGDLEHLEEEGGGVFGVRKNSGSGGAFFGGSSALQGSGHGPPSAKC